MKLKVSTIKGQEHFGDGKGRGGEERGGGKPVSLTRVLEAEENQRRKRREGTRDIGQKASF